MSVCKCTCAKTLGLCLCFNLFPFFKNYKSECILSQRVDMGQVSCGVEYTRRRSALKGTGRRLRSIFFDVLKTLSSFKTVSYF